MNRRTEFKINFNRYFYTTMLSYSVAEIDKELKQLEAEIANLLKGVVV